MNNILWQVVVFCLGIQYGLSNQIVDVKLFQGDSVALLKVFFSENIPAQRAKTPTENSFIIEFKECVWNDSIILPSIVQKIQTKQTCGLSLELERKSPFSIQSKNLVVEVRFPNAGVLNDSSAWAWYTGIGAAIVGGATMLWWIGGEVNSSDKGIPDPNIGMPE